MSVINQYTHKRIVGPLEFEYNEHHLKIRRTHEQLILITATYYGILILHILAMCVLVPIALYQLRTTYGFSGSSENEIDMENIGICVTLLILGIVCIASLLSVIRKIIYLTFRGRSAFIIEGNTGMIYFGGRHLGKISQITDIKIKSLVKYRFELYFFERLELSIHLSNGLIHKIVDNMTQFSKDSNAQEAIALIKDFVGYYAKNAL